MILDGGFVILDTVYDSYEVNYPFQIKRFRALCEHCWDEHHLFLGETHDFWEFSLVLEGEYEGVSSNKVYHHRPGHFGCCPPMVFHSSHSIGYRCHVLNFALEITGSFPPALTEGGFQLSSAEISELSGIFYRLRDAYIQTPRDEYKGAEATNALSAFLMRLCRDHTPRNVQSDSRSSRLYQQVIETMQQVLYENLSIQEISQRNAISTTTVKDLFRKYTGVGPKKYYSDMRGIEALRLLSEGVDISEITEKMNYSSVGYFTNVFKKQFGLPPSRYRKRLNASENTNAHKPHL